MRRPYIDNVRWVTVVLVVLFHVIYMFNGIAPEGVVGPFYPVQYQDAVQYILYPWFMVVLFLLSGMCARYALERKSDREFLKERTRKLLVPSTIGLLVFQWIQGYVNMTLSGAFDQMPAEMPKVVLYLIMALSGSGVLWTIQMMWVYSLALVLLRKLEKGRLAALCEKLPASPVLLAALGIGEWAAAQVLNTPVIVVYHFGTYGFAFFAGYYIFSQEKMTDCLAKWGPAFGGAALILAASQVKTYFGQSFAVSPVVNAPLTVTYLWCTCLAVLGLMKRYGDKETGLTRFMARKSWGLYLFHYLPLSFLALVLTRHTDLAPVWIYLLCGVGAYLVPLPLYELISRVPVLRWCVLGIGKGGAKRV